MGKLLGQAIYLPYILTCLVVVYNHHACAQSFIDDDVLQRQIKWMNSPNPGSIDDFLVNVTVNGVDFQYVPIDTGSTGFLLSAKSLHYDNESELEKCCKRAFQFLSSSRRFYEGYWLPSTLTFKSATDREFHSETSVFAVTESGNCSSFKDGNCTKDLRKRMPTGIQYMGVGFGRWSAEQPNATADKNVLLNVDLGSDHTLRSGYIVSDQGLTLGVRATDFADGWALTNLTRNLDPNAPQGRPEWNGTPMCVKVADSECLEGTALFDTGINYSFLGVPSRVTQNTNVTDGKLTLLRNGTEVNVKVGGSEERMSTFSFKVGDFNEVPQITPNRVRLVREHIDGAYINTGRFFYNGFSLLFDEYAGIVGLKRKIVDDKSSGKSMAGLLDFETEL